MAEESMRLDKFLWFARYAKTRADARAIAEKGHLRIDGRAVNRPHSPVRVGAVLTFAHRGDVHVIRIEILPSRRGPPSEAASCVTVLSPVDAGAYPT